MIMADRNQIVARLVAGIDPRVRGTPADRPGASPEKGFGVPPERAERDRLRRAARRFVEPLDLTPPLPLADLVDLARRAVADASADPAYTNFMAVLVSNEVWKDEVASTPFDRRIFLLPQCLRSRRCCRGEFDELGLLCAGCGACPIAGLEDEAERLGYITLVAEGTTVACRLLEMGLVDAVVGVSCLSVLERAFAPMSEDAVPGLAIPLIRDGCEDTAVDVDWVREALNSSAPRRRPRIDIEALRSEVSSWFEPDALGEVLGQCDGETTQIAHDWLARAGKRWRPFLGVCIARALSGGERPSDSLRRLAVAVECFHKASLIHDDIEDADGFRYEDASLHRRYGVPVALNVGDFLIGEGYRLIAGCPVRPARIAQMLSIAADGHRTLCLGQGAELCWRRRPRILEPAEVLDIFRRKTAGAFEVAMRLAAAAAGADATVHSVLRAFSSALGAAYQVGDDIDDFAEDSSARLATRPPSLVFALACGDADGAERSELARLWFEDGDQRRVGKLVRRTGAPAAAEIFEECREEAVRALEPLRNVELKSLLQRCIGRILGPPRSPRRRLPAPDERAL